MNQFDDNAMCPYCKTGHHVDLDYGIETYYLTCESCWEAHQSEQPDETYDTRIINALKVVEGVLQNHFNDSHLEIGYRNEDCEAFCKSERFNMSAFFADELLPGKIDNAIRPLGFFLDWTTSNLFWLFSL